jgi:hypothetical protein
MAELMGAAHALAYLLSMIRASTIRKSVHRRSPA